MKRPSLNILIKTAIESGLEIKQIKAFADGGFELITGQKQEEARKEKRLPSLKKVA